MPLLKSDIVGTPQLTLDLGNGQRLNLAQGDLITVRSPTNGQTAVNLANAPLLFVGYGVSAPERNWDDFKGLDVKGKLLVVLINDPDFEGGDGDFGGKAMTYYGRWTYKYEEAARRGAAGVLIVHETAPASYGWSVVKNSNTITMFDIVRQQPGGRASGVRKLDPAPARRADFRRFGTQFRPGESRRQAARFQARPAQGDAHRQYPGSDLDHHLAQCRRAPARQANIPTRRSSTRAHWDHLGIGKPDASGDAIYNGAVDNGTGIAQLIEQARAFARDPRPRALGRVPRRHRGGEGPARQRILCGPPALPARQDGCGSEHRCARRVRGPTRNFSHLRHRQARPARRSDRRGQARRAAISRPTPHPEAGSFYRSDHFSFAKVGVPAISFDTGNDLVNGGIKRGEALSDDYVDQRYHQPGDEWSSSMDFRGIAAGRDAAACLGERLANSREWPNWTPDSEFRAVRDRSAAERNAEPAARKGERG